MRLGAGCIRVCVAPLGPYQGKHPAMRGLSSRDRNLPPTHPQASLALSLVGELPSAPGVGCPLVPCPGSLRQHRACGAGEIGTCEGLWLGWPSPPQSRGLLSPGSPEHRRAVPRCCVVTSCQGGRSCGVRAHLLRSHMQDCWGAWGYFVWEVTRATGASPPPECHLQPVSVVGHRELAASTGTARICRAGIV